ncbi:GPN-loop GTPase QQT2 [Euphorbia peplus]|nr:GPN-loop GTPase QQT2 [Euphorbia peplus]
MDIDSDLEKITVKSTDEGSSMQLDAKEKEELSETMDKLGIKEPASGPSNFKRKPVVIIVVGMAGSGKTTFMHRLVYHTQATNLRGYVLNLDPAVMTLPYGANIDIRDTVRYKEVMKQFNLGPNGGILTSLNLFATKFDEVIQVIEKRADQLDYVLVDTPGQIEIFTCILYKTRLPLVLAFNKTDIAQHQFALEWMEDFEAFQAAVSSDNSYSSTLAQSLSLVLDEFYKNLKSVGVSAVSGAGMDAFFKAVEASAEEYIETYKADLDKRRAEKLRLEEERRRENMEKLRKEMEKTKGETVVLSTGLKDKEAKEDKEDDMMDRDGDEEDEDDDFERFSEEDEEDGGIDEDDEEVGRFNF